MALINVRHNEVDCAANLTVPSVLRQEDGLTLPGQLEKEWKTRLELMLPINDKAQALHVERQAVGCASDSELRYDCLSHDVPPMPPNV